MTMGFMLILSCLGFLAPVRQAHLQSATIADLSFQNMDFAMNLYKKISNYHDENIFFSPLSISTSFAALLMASDGDTYKEILKGLNLEKLEQADQPELIPTLFQRLHENITQDESLDQGMALFMRQQFEIENVLKDQLKTFFYADLKSVDFADTKGSISFINEFINNKTRGKVPEMISTLDAATYLMLIDTIFFQGKLNHSCTVRSLWALFDLLVSPLNSKYHFLHRILAEAFQPQFYSKCTVLH